ncbi:leucine-rich repeat-containing protein 9 [Patella vulgata]|uniref:leucine-rich repeat-containing protein 9 n=1 Tax=Patella vulgata TaxID=6465 RepID=UPI00217FC1B7|nr:leucine-rich repeat-containing protein 9 [Patella vulgata]
MSNTETGSDTMDVESLSEKYREPFLQSIPHRVEEKHHGPKNFYNYTAKDQEIIREVCVNNGINFNRVFNDDQSLEVLEMFFSGFPQMIGLNHFPNLQSLTIIGQSIQRIEGLTILQNLQQLWLCECEITKIENIDHLKKLKKLYLYSNQIKKIENIKTLNNLEVLWLNNNHIENIENISTLWKLSELNLAENRIRIIGHCLDANTHLREVNLSGNPITSLKDITNLVRLPKLVNISFKDPQYEASPVSILCNYSTHVLYHLPYIQRLDTFDVSIQHLAEIAESTVSKKKMYYNMRMKAIHCNLSSVKNRLEKYRDLLLEFPQKRILNLVNTIKELEREEEIQVMSADINSETESERDAKFLKNITENTGTKSIVQKTQELKKRRKQWEKKCVEIGRSCLEAVDRVVYQSENLINRLIIELETGGNVRFEDGSAIDTWFSSCQDLVLSRFCAADYREKGIVGIKIHQIVRIHHRLLRIQFDNKLEDMTEDKNTEDFLSTKPTCFKKNLEYLFWMWNPSSVGGLKEPYQVLEEGFSDADTYQVNGI